MKPKEAIAILGFDLQVARPQMPKKTRQAVALAIAALTLLDNPTDPRLIYALSLLPENTKK